MMQPPPQNHLLIQFEKITRELWEWIDRENKRLQEELQEEAKVSCRCGHKESEHKSLDSRPFGKKCEEWSHGWARTEGGFICERCGVRRNTNGVKEAI